MLGYEVVELFRETGIVDVDQATKDVGQSFIDHYEHTLEVLKEDEKLNKMLQILFGPVIDAKLTDAEELQRYGLIKLNDEDVYVAFSEHFQTYLRICGPYGRRQR
jgi:isocitrate/isopropylmalate dehydrogenase